MVGMNDKYFKNMYHVHYCTGNGNGNGLRK